MILLTQWSNLFSSRAKRLKSSNNHVGLRRNSRRSLFKVGTLLKPLRMYVHTYIQNMYLCMVLPVHALRHKYGSTTENPSALGQIKLFSRGFVIIINYGSVTLPISISTTLVRHPHPPVKVSCMILNLSIYVTNSRSFKHLTIHNNGSILCGRRLELIIGSQTESLMI